MRKEPMRPGIGLQHSRKIDIIYKKRAFMTRCEMCKHYSRLVVVPSRYGECWYCQSGNCIFCTHDGEYCDGYSPGENDGGRTEESYLDEDEEEYG